MGQGGSRVTLMEAWPASLRILSTKLCCSCACKYQLPSLISPFPRAHPCPPAAGPRALRRMHCVQHPRAKPGGGRWTEASLVHLTRFSAPLAGAELRSFAWRSARLTPLTGPHLSVSIGFPGGSDGKESAHNAGELGSIPGSGRTPGGREWLPTLVFLPGEFRGQRSLAAYTVQSFTESDTAE